MKKSQKKQLLSIAFVLLLAGLTFLTLYFSGDDLSIETLRATFNACNGWWLTAAVVCMLLYALFEAIALHVISANLGYRKKFTSSLAYSTSDVYYSGITPSATGGQPASAYYMIRDGIPGGTACFALVFNLLCYTAALLVIGIVVFVTNFSMFLGFSFWVKVLVIAGFVAQATLMTLFIACIVRPGAVRKLGNFFVTLLLSIRILKNEEKWRTKVNDSVEKYRSCYECFKKQRLLFWEVLFFNVVQRVALIMVSVFVCLSMIDCSPWEMFSMQAYAMIGYNSIPLPGGSGAYEYLYLNIYGGVFTAEFTLVAMLVTRLISYYLSILVNGVYTMIYHVFAPSARGKGQETQTTSNEKEVDCDEKS